MNTKPLERFAQTARRDLLAQVTARLDYVLGTDSAELRAQADAIEQLQTEIRRHGRETVIDRAAYTWFNRFCALRFMDANRYTPLGIVSPAPGHTQPELLAEAKAGHIDPAFPVDRGRVLDLLAGRAPSRDGQGEAYRLLLVAACNRFHTEMPFLFERIVDWTELLLPDDLLSAGSVPAAARRTLTEEACRDVEVIGWLYQFYISERKDAVIGSKQKIVAEDIPAATQLFTPHWIVRYLVENSLGRLWLLNRPNSRLAERMEYYVPPSPVIPGEARNLSPEELRLCDPACGSGHILTYAFDLLHAIYEEEGYNPADIPRLILSKNLTGLEIDERAGGLAAFALMMKGRARDRRFFDRDVRPDIVVLRPPGIDREQLAGADWFRALGRTLLDRPLQEALLNDLHCLDQADNLGSLIRPQLTVEGIEELRGRIGGATDLLNHTLNARVMGVLAQLEALARPYHVVAANPPYMGNRNINDTLKKFAEADYPDSKSDLFAMFIERGFDLVKPNGYNAMVTMQSWMFLSSYEKLRERLLNEVTIECMVHMDNMVMGIAFGTAATVWQKAHNPDHKGCFSYVYYEDLTQDNKPKEFPVQNERLARASAADFRKIPGSPIAYWVSDRVRDAYSNTPSLNKIAEPRQGLATGDNDKYLRFWSEVRISAIGFELSDRQQAIGSTLRWFPCNKGGSFKKWYGNQEFVVDWFNDGHGIRNNYDSKGKQRSRPQNVEFYFREGMTWSTISSAQLSMRYSPTGFLFETKGSMCFAQDRDSLLYALGYCNTKLVDAFLLATSPTLDFHEGPVGRLPLKVIDDRVSITSIVNKLVALARTDWDAYETSWDFTTLPLLRPEHRRETLAATYAALREQWWAMTLEMQRLEEENNRLFIDAYGLSDELTPDVPLREITLTCNPYYRYGLAEEQGGGGAGEQGGGGAGEKGGGGAGEKGGGGAGEKGGGEESAAVGGRRSALGEARLLADTMREFISYAVGCLFGRYSLDAPGLILADAGATVENYELRIRNYELGEGRRGEGEKGRGAGSELVFRISYLVSPDRDGVLPILDGDWFADDIVGQFKRFLRVTFGDDRFEENLAFIEAALGRDIRVYFLREFYDHHVKTYKKRPIYWLFSSPGGSFNVLIYLHRYRPDTASVVLNDYLRDYRLKLEAQRENLRRVSVSEAATPREKTAALRDLDKLEKTLTELRDYESETLYPLAARRVELDLDDGVKMNYNKLGRALKKVTGLSE